ncbi:MAG: TadE/TadG family type IV pilus assembly protein, partial [Terriglobia bacterium]
MHQPLPLGGCGMCRPVTAHACAPSVQTESGQQGLPKIHWNPKQLIRFRRAGATLVIVAMLLTFFVGILSLSVDLGYVRLTHAQMQNSADAAALAAAQDLPSNELVMATPDYGAIHSLARNTAVQFAAANYVENQPPLVDSNPSN